MDNVQADISTWAEKTFVHDEHSIAAHLLSEATELYMSAGGTWTDAIRVVFEATSRAEGRGKDCIPDGVADVMILGFTMAGYSRFSAMRAILRKMVVNRGRAWGKKNDLGFVEHVRMKR